MTITETKPRRATRPNKAQQAADAAHAEQLAHHEAEVARWLAKVEELGRQIGDDIANWRIATPPSADPRTWNTPVLRYWMFEAAMRWNYEQAETLRKWGKPVICMQCAVEENEGRPGPAWAAWKCFDHAWRDYLAGEAWERAKAHGGQRHERRVLQRDRPLRRRVAAEPGSGRAPAGGRC